MPLGDLISRAAEGAIEGSFDQMLAQSQSTPEADPMAGGSGELVAAGSKPLENGVLTDIPDEAQILAAFRQMTDTSGKSGGQAGAVIPAVIGSEGGKNGDGMAARAETPLDLQVISPDAVTETDVDAEALAALPAMIEAAPPPTSPMTGGSTAAPSPMDVLQTATKGPDTAAAPQPGEGRLTPNALPAANPPVGQQAMAPPLVNPTAQSALPSPAQPEQLRAMLDPVNGLANGGTQNSADVQPGVTVAAAAQLSKAAQTHVAAGAQTDMPALIDKPAPAGGQPVSNPLPEGLKGLDIAAAAPTAGGRLASGDKADVSPQPAPPPSADRPTLPAGTAPNPSHIPQEAAPPEPIVFKFKINPDAQDLSSASGEKQPAQATALRDPAPEPLREPGTSVQSSAASNNAAPQVDRADARPETARQAPPPSAEQAQTQVLRNALALNMRDAQWGQKLVAQIEKMHSDGQARYDISLRPKNLGDMRVHLEFHGDETQVRIVTETASAARVLIGGEDRLSQMLEASGFRLAAFSSSMGGQAGAGQGQPQFAKRGADPAAAKSKTTRPGQQQGAAASARQSGPQGTINVIA
jgi:hypothetical protein